MALSALDDRDSPPTPASVREVLGRAAAAWDELVEHVSAAHGPVTAQWSFSSPRHGWSLRLAGPRRVLLYLIPCRRHFLAGIVLGEKAAAAAGLSGTLPDRVIEAVEAAPRYAEGRGLRLPVRSKKENEPVKELLRLKLG